MNPLNQRERDLLRYCRGELHEAGLVTDDEYVEMLGWGSNGPGKGSPSARRLEDYDELRTKIDMLKETLVDARRYINGANSYDNIYYRIDSALK